MPVLPAVDSTTSPPGLRSPRCSASRIIHLPARSFTDWPGFMNSALPRMVQPVASEARFNLMSGVLPMASTTSLLKIMSGSAGVSSILSGEPSQRWLPAQADPAAWLSARLCKHHLTHVDISGEKSGLAIGEIILPQPPEPLVETKRLEVRPSVAEVISPGRKRLGIILPEDALADDRHAKAFAERFEDLRRGQHAAGKDIALDKVDFPTIGLEIGVLDGDGLDASESARRQPITQLRKISRPE